MINVITLFNIILFACFVLTLSDIIKRAWNGFPVTVEDVISHSVLLMIILLLTYLVI